jgi:hypothetical protein
MHQSYDLAIVETPHRPSLEFRGTPVTSAEIQIDGGPKAYWIGFDEPPNVAILDARIQSLDPRIIEVVIHNFDISLLSNRWNGTLILNLEKYGAALSVRPVWEQWTSIVKYEVLQSAVEYAALASQIPWVKASGSGIYAERNFLPDDSTIGSVLDSFVRTLDPLLVSAFRRAATESRDALVTIFQFPPAVASACEQYLLNFATFLHDLGASATTDIRHEASAVLFTVKPSNPNESLSKIGAALDVYLQVPSASLDRDTSAAVDEQIVIDRLTMAVHYLKSQLAAAAMTIRLQEGTISAQSVAIAAQRQLIAGNGAHDSEPIVSDLLEVVALERSGLRLNLPRIVRKLKKLFRS